MPTRRLGSRRAPLQLLRPLVALVVAAAAALAPAAASYLVADSLAGPVWDGVGASFTGASARLVVEYEEPWRSQILDSLFAPSCEPSTSGTFKGAALQILRLEIGGDANSDGGGSAPAHMRSAADAPNAARGWAWWLAAEAFKRNPSVKIMLVPVAWPAYLNGGDAGAASPFADPVAAADYVAAYIAPFEAQSGAKVGFIGLWGSALASVSVMPGLVAYALALRAALDAAGLSHVKLVCADQQAPGDWSCLAAVDENNMGAYDPALAAALGVVGNAGRPPSVIGAGVKASMPVWSTHYFSKYVGRELPTFGLNVFPVTNEIIETVVFAALNGSARLPSGFIFPYGVTGTSYGFGPWWHFGLVMADQPHAGSWHATAAAWQIASLTQFVPADGSWRLLPAGSGTGLLDGGGYYVSFFRPVTGEFVIVAQLYFDDKNWVAPVHDQSAVFSLAGQLALGRFTSVIVWRTCVPQYQRTPVDWALFELVATVPISDNEISLQMTAGCTYSIAATGPGTISPWSGCSAAHCESTPPPPAKLGDIILTFGDASSCPRLSGPGKYMVDICGSFECVADSALGPCLQQTSSGRSIGPFRGSRPHSLTGDLDSADVVVTVDVAVASGQAGLLGARIKSAQRTGQAMELASGLWVALQPSPGAIGWALVGDLSDASFASPILAGSVPTSRDFSGQWFTARLLLRGPRAVGSVVLDGSSVLLFNVDVNSSVGSEEGFIGLGAGNFVPGAASFRNLVIAGSTTTCDLVPPLGAPVTVEMCNDGAPGQVFEVVLPPEGALLPGNFSVSTIPRADAWRLDCGPKLASRDLAGRTLLCAANFTASLSGGGSGDTCGCIAFNGNGVPKSSLADMAPYEKVDLFILQLPPLQLALSANTSLCLALGGADGISLVLAACAPAGAAPPTQTWAFSRLFRDGALTSGPLSSGTGETPLTFVLDVWGLSDDIGAQVRIGDYHRGSNQVFDHPFPAMKGIIRATQLGVCLGACVNY